MLLEIFKIWKSNKSGTLSPVSSQPVMIPSSRLSAVTKDCRLTRGINLDFRKTFLEINFLRLIHPETILKEVQSDDVQRNREAVPEAGRTKTSHTSEDRQNQGTIPMPTLATRPLTTSSTAPVELPRNYMAGQQRQQILEMQFVKFPNPQSLLVWKIRWPWRWGPQGMSKTGGGGPARVPNLRVQTPPTPGGTCRRGRRAK